MGRGLEKKGEEEVEATEEGRMEQVSELQPTLPLCPRKKQLGL